MKTLQLKYSDGDWTDFPSNRENKDLSFQSNLVLAFGDTALASDATKYTYLKDRFPKADIVIMSTSGEILDRDVSDDTIVATAIEFEKTTLRCVSTTVDRHANSYEVGKHIMKELAGTQLCSVLVLSEGSFINGSDLVTGINSVRPEQVTVTGGLAGDADRFQKTVVGLNGPAQENRVVAIGFYGENIRIGHSSFGGWDEFGRERTVTKSDRNILLELDNQNALELYKEYLGSYADDLPGSALLFPLSLKLENENKNLVRTILTIDNEAKTMTFAGNLPEGSKVRLMKANFEKLIHASGKAAKESLEGADTSADLALLISCVGRKLVLQDRAFEEVVAAKEIFGEHTAIMGFYSYGELSPLNPKPGCELHNQTMTITTFTES